MIERWSAGWRPYALLLLLSLGLYLPGLAALPVTDRDEARFAQATRQMLESHDFLHIRFQDEARNKKPAGIYWLQSAAVAALSTPESAAIWPYRLPSLAGALVAVLLTFALGRVLVGGPAALLGAALLGASIGVVVEAHLAKTDAVLLATAAAAQAALGILYAAARRGSAPAPRRWAALFWIAQGAAILVKGPIVPFLSLLTAGTLSLADRDARWLRDLRPLWGVPLMLAIALPWFVAITLATGGAFLGEAAGHDLFGKIVGAQEAHGAWPGYYLLLLFVTFWPGALLLGPAAAWGWQARGETGARFLLAWALPFWFVLELVPTKLPHYILPAYPALALLAARGALALAHGELRRRRWLDGIAGALWLAVTLALAAALVLLPLRFAGALDLAGVVAAAILAGFGTRLALAVWRRGGSGGIAVRAALLALLVLPPTLALVVPALNGLWLSRAAAALVAQYHPPPGAPIVAVGDSEPSLVFLLGTATREVSPDAAAQVIASSPGAAALVNGADDAAFQQALKQRGCAARALGRVGGLDYSTGRALALTLYTAGPG
ncbi:MAG TPA: phospholipid carrier-dependent glycosyltransferase [Stellaceae bacterium]|nr:phospholipid carrier-dependent glycosyltransferase [Stellaceae bacterium]